MRALYHHTDPAYLPSIMEVGLLARPWSGGEDDDPERRGMLSAILHNRSVVWLTTQPTALFSKADIEFLRRQGRDDEAATGTWLMRNGGKVVRLEIDVPRHSKKLFHYRTWVKANEVLIIFGDGKGRCNDAREPLTTASHLSDCLPTMLTHWYIHFGDIPPRRISTVS
jgi:hypothetical protein